MRLWTACIRTSENTAQGPAATWGNGMCSSSTYCDICSRWLSHLCVLSRSCLRSSDMCWRAFAVAKWFSVWPDLRRKIKAPRGVIFGMLRCALLCQTSTRPRHVWGGVGTQNSRRVCLSTELWAPRSELLGVQAWLVLWDCRRFTKGKSSLPNMWES